MELALPLLEELDGWLNNYGCNNVIKKKLGRLTDLREMVEFTLVYIKIKKTISTQYPTLVSSFIPGIYLNTLIQTVKNTHIQI